MTDKLPQNLRALFAPRPPLRFLPAHDHATETRHTARISGVAQFLPALAEKAEVARKSDAGELTKDDAGFEPPPTLSELEKGDNEAREKQEKQNWLISEGAKALYKPAEDAQVRGNAYHTLFISRLSYDVETKDLEREFSRYGAIERIRIVVDSGDKWQEMKERGVDMKKVSKKRKQGASRGYAFIVFENEADMRAAYKETDGLSIKGRRILVDVERGRTVNGWKPRRYGGGLGGRHYTKAGPRPGGFGLGPPMRGGFRGGFRGDGGFRGGRGGGGGFRGGQGGIGYSNGGPPTAPRGGGGYGDRGPRNANFEPLPSRGGYRDRDGGGGGGGYGGGRGGGGGSFEDRGRKRPYDGGGYGGYDESRSRPRY